MIKYSTIDLCAGIGGIRKGFELTGRVNSVLSAENDKFACETYQHLYNEDAFNDITTDEFKNKLKDIHFDILLAGFPCQAFSAVGNRDGFKDVIRGTIFFHIAEILEKNKPKAFLLENVEGLITHKKGETFKVILDTLINQLNYEIVGIHKNIMGDFVYDKKDILLNARNFGLPQNRPRVYLLGFDKNRYKDNTDIISLKTLPRKRQAANIFNDLNDIIDFGEDEKYYLSQGYLDTLKRHKSNQKNKGNGFGYVVVNESHIKNPVSNTILATGGSGKERNLVYDKQENIYGKTVKGKQTPLNNEGIRAMTPNEWAKLQGFIGYAFLENGVETFGFPDNISDTQRYKQLGNSVAIPVIEEIAKLTIKILDELEGV